MAFTQISVQNVTPQERHIFVLAEKLPVNEVNSISLGAWEGYLLATGEYGFSAYSSEFQLVVHSKSEGAQNRRLLMETPLGTGWDFKVDNGAPSLIQGKAVSAREIQCNNRSSEPIAVGLFNNFSRLVGKKTISPQQIVIFQPENTLFFYASVPVTDPNETIVLEPEIVEVDISGPQVAVQLLLEGSTLRWGVS